MTDGYARPPSSDATPGLSTAELVSRAVEQISTLARDELALVKSELISKGKRAGIGGGMFGASGILALYGLGLLLALAVIGLDAVWPLWAAVLVVAVVVFVIAGLAALLGRRKLATATPLLPTEAQRGIVTDLKTVKTALQEGRHA